MFPSRILAFLAGFAFALAAAAQSSLWPNPAASEALPDQWGPGTAITLSTYETFSPGTTFSWFHNGQPLAGKAAATLTLSGLRLMDAGNYWMQSTVGSVVRTTDIFTLNVSARPGSPVDTTFSAELPPNDEIAAVVTGASDRSLLIGYATSPNKTWIKLLSNGTRDRSFVLPQTAGDILARFPDGRILAAKAPYLFAADGRFIGMNLPAGFHDTSVLSAAVIQPDGRLLIAQDDAISRLNVDGTIDLTFHFSSANLAGAYLHVHSLKTDASGRLYVGADTAQSADGADAVRTVFRLTAVGAYDPTFATQHNRLGLIAITPLADGRLMRVQPVSSWLNECTLLREDGAVLPDARELKTLLPFPVLVDAARHRLFHVFGSRIAREAIGAAGIQFDPAFYPGVGMLRSMFLNDDGNLLVTGAFTEWDGHSTVRLVRLRAGDDAVSAPSAEIVASTNA